MAAVWRSARRALSDPEIAKRALEEACEQIAHEEWMGRNFPKEHPHVPRIKDSYIDDKLSREQKLRKGYENRENIYQNSLEEK